MIGSWTQPQRLHQLFAMSPLLTLIVALDFAAYVGGLLFWYGPVMEDPVTPMWAWLFIPDCPLFGLLGALGLLMVIAQRFWAEPLQQSTQKILAGIGFIILLLWITTYLPGVALGWARYDATFALLSWSLLLTAALFRRAPIWLLCIFAFGQIKYGIWTITAWTVFWRNTALLYGSPLFTFDSIFMTLTHIGLFGQGIILLLYFRPTLLGTLISLSWFVLSDYIDYGLGFYPALPLQLIPLPVMQWSTIAVTWLLGALFFFVSRHSRTIRHSSNGIEVEPVSVNLYRMHS